MENGLDRNQPVNIYWFSGSGNSLLIAVEIKSCLSEQGYSVNLFPMEKTDPADVDTHAVTGFVVPVAGQGTYPLVWEFLQNLPFAENTPCFFMDTLGAYSGGILGPVRKIIRKKGYLPIAAKEILMPNIVMKMKNRPEKENKAVERGRKQARRFCDNLIDGKGLWVDIPVYSWLISRLYRSRRLVRVFIKMFPWSLDSRKCINCGICVSICPEKCLGINEETGLPAPNTKCTLCHRCFEFCPNNAIHIGSKKAKQYTAVSLKNLQLFLKVQP